MQARFPAACTTTTVVLTSLRCDCGGGGGGDAVDRIHINLPADTSPDSAGAAPTPAASVGTPDMMQ